MSTPFFRTDVSFASLDAEKLRRFLGAAAMVLSTLPMAAHGAVANFSDGNGATTPDQWLGTPGDGWVTQWQVLGNTTATSVVNTSPLHGGGNYLQFVDNTTTVGAYARRQYESFGELDITQPYRITLSYRYDSSLATFNQFNDRIAIFGDTAAQTGTAATNTWLIGVAGGNGGAGVGQSVNPGDWYFFDNNGSNAFNTSNMFDTDLAFVAGRTYAITIDVNPILGTYGASIDDGVNPAVSAVDLTFRRGTAAASSWFHIAHNSSDATENTNFSFDSLVIVPEPSAAVVLLIGAGTILTRRRRFA